MKKLYFAAILATLSFPAIGQTIISSGSVSGVWSISGSPYIIQTDLWVPPGQSLQINAGVEVRFMGLHRMIVQGTLRSLGTPEMRVLFHQDDTTGWANDAGITGGWRGIWLKPAAAGDSSIMRYTDIRDLKVGTSGPSVGTTGPTGIYMERKMSFHNCTFRHNQSSTGNIIMLMPPTAVTIEFDSCDISGNRANFSVLYSAQTPASTAWIHHSTIANNKGGNTIYSFQNNLSMEDNDISNNSAPHGYSVIQSSHGASVSLLRNRIHHNVSGTVGSVYLMAKSVDVSHNYICNNSLVDRFNCGVASGGGAMFLTGGMTGGKRYLIRNNVIANNYSAWTGGAVAMNEADVLFTNNTFANNESDYYSPHATAFFGIKNCTLSFTNNIFKGNVSSSGNIHQDTATDIMLLAGGNISFSNNLIDAPLASFGNNVTWTGATSTNIVSGQPGFVAPTVVAGLSVNAMTANFSTGSSAVGVNKGDSTGAQCLAKDIKGASRIAGRSVDIGAFEHQAPTAINALQQAHKEIVAYPNPATDRLTVKGIKGDYLMISSVTGQLLAGATFNADTEDLDISALASGNYFVVISDADGVKARTVITKK